MSDGSKHKVQGTDKVNLDVDTSNTGAAATGSIGVAATIKIGAATQVTSVHGTVAGIVVDNPA